MKLTKIGDLGAGGFGRVELVRDDQGQEFARKTFSIAANLPPAMIENVRKRFAKEAKTQSGIEHRNIVKVWPVGVKDDPPWYLMPVAESSLQDQLSKDKTLGGNFLAAISDIVAGLDEMHQMQIFHRDIKPQNVLRFPDSNSPSGFRYAVSDFGLIAMTDSRLSSLTTTGMAKGTDYFTAPEITADLRMASARSDVYSLGCILHEMVGQGPRVPCHEISETGEYGAILRACTRTDPSRRFPSVRAVLDALLAVSGGLPNPTTAEAVNFSQKLEAGGPLDSASWKALTEYVEDNGASDSGKAVLFRLRGDQITDICNSDPAMAARLGIVYADWIARSSFDFDRCDVLANNLEIFIASCAFDTKTDGLMALLRLGTSHNRWYVEHMFMRLCGPQMESDLAKRLAVEFRATGDDICEMVEHLERSIGASRANLHPVLSQALGQICP